MQLFRLPRYKNTSDEWPAHSTGIYTAKIVIVIFTVRHSTGGRHRRRRRSNALVREWQEGGGLPHGGH